MNRILYVGFDQLHRNYGVLRTADPISDRIVLVESQRMLANPNWHQQRVYFLVSSARHFAKDLQASGFKVDYIKAATTVGGIQHIRGLTGITEVWAAEPNSYRLQSALIEANVNLIPNDFFLTSRNDFKAWADSQKTHVMENFYRAQRKRLNILMNGNEPVGGQWNYDADNRLPPPKNHSWPQPLQFAADEIDLAVAAEISGKYWGDAPSDYWATTRSGALQQLSHFVENVFNEFGPYEDAMPKESWAANHSLLSPYLNNGLLHAREVLDAVLATGMKIPLNSLEGFVRQLIGWREYINGMYWFYGADYREENHLNANRKLLPLFRDPDKTEMQCVKSIVSDVHARSWVHHIPRLMVLSNLALLAGIKPQEYLTWMREVFIDAADWVMVPNVIGMGVHADGGKMMTKPYAAGGAYISRMSNYCKGCKFDPKLRTGESACPFTSLYWDFLARNREEFATNHRMFQQVNGLKRLSDLDETRERAAEVLVSLEHGEL